MSKTWPDKIITFRKDEKISVGKKYALTSELTGNKVEFTIKAIYSVWLNKDKIIVECDVK